jgi:SAM-dependent methyltransferase
MKIFLVIFMLLNSIISNANEPNAKRLLLSSLRGGDYAHAGDKEAINLVLEQVLTINPKIKNGKVLDVGCGFGGTLEYLKLQGFKALSGIDINGDSITYAKTKYKDINFTILDALQADHLDDKFDLIIMFNSSYAIENKAKLFQALGKVANLSAILVIFDYAIESDNKTLAIKDFAGKAMYPIDLKSLPQNLEDANWNLLKTEDLSKQFIIWYEQFLDNLREQQQNLETKFLKTDIEQVDNSFAYFLSELKAKKLSGVVIYANKK